MKTIVFDFDGTLTTKNNNIWTNIWKRLDAMDVDEILYKKYYNKEIDYKEWCVEIEKEYIKRKFSLEMLNDITKDMKLIATLEDTLKILKNSGYSLYIVSGGIDVVIKRVLGELASYFDDIYSCKFEFDSNGLLTHIEPTRYDDEGKKWFIDEYCEKTGSEAREITFVGNDTNDEYVHLSGCNTICFNPASKANHQDNKIWHNVVCSDKIIDVLPLLGVKKR